MRASSPLARSLVDSPFSRSDVTSMLPELSELQRVRWDKIQTLRDKGVDPYPLRSNRTRMTSDVVAMGE